MCSIADLLPQEEELSTEQILHIIDEAKNCGIKEVLLTGGEPLSHPDFPLFFEPSLCYGNLEKHAT